MLLFVGDDASDDNRRSGIRVPNRSDLVMQMLKHDALNSDRSGGNGRWA